MLFQDNTRFWIVFDTCTRREYYQDVHNLLTLPSGAIIRYEYRDKYLSSGALAAAQKSESAPSRILLLYGQRRQYVRGEAAPPASTGRAEMLWVATRIGEMQLIPRPEGANFFFDFKVLGYPKQDNASLTRILGPRIDDNETPFTKWVCLSDDLESLAALNAGDESENWQSIVDRLGTPPIQFSADSFMRLKGPFRTSNANILKPTYLEERQRTENKVETRKIVSLYDLHENDTYSFEVISHSPPPSDPRATEIQRTLTMVVDKDGPLSLPGDTALDLRQYTGQIIRFRAKRYEEMDQKTGNIRFDVGTGTDGWPIGSNLSLTFRVSKQARKALAGLFFGGLAAFLLLFATKIWDRSIMWGAITGIVGILSGVIAGLLLTGKLSFKA